MQLPLEFGMGARSRAVKILNRNESNYRSRSCWSNVAQTTVISVSQPVFTVMYLLYLIEQQYY